MAINPAEDINNILIVFVPLRLFAAGDFFMSVVISHTEVKYATCRTQKFSARNRRSWQAL